MATYNATQNWTAVSATGLAQVRGGTILWAATNAPAADDWLVFPEGAVFTIGTAGFIRAALGAPKLSVVAV